MQPWPDAALGRTRPGPCSGGRDCSDLHPCAEGRGRRNGFAIGFTFASQLAAIRKCQQLAHTRLNALAWTCPGSGC